MEWRHAILSQKAGLPKAACGPPAMYTQALARLPPVAGKPRTSGLDELDSAFGLVGLMFKPAPLLSLSHVLLGAPDRRSARTHDPWSFLYK